MGHGWHGRSVHARTKEVIRQANDSLWVLFSFFLGQVGVSLCFVPLPMLTRAYSVGLRATLPVFIYAHILASPAFERYRFTFAYET